MENVLLHEKWHNDVALRCPTEFRMCIWDYRILLVEEVYGSKSTIQKVTVPGRLEITLRIQTLVRP